MFRFMLSLIIITLIIVYLVIPFIKGIRKVMKNEVKRIDNAFDDKENKEDNWRN